MQQNPVNFNLSWNGHENYWICLVLPEADSLFALEDEFSHTGLNSTHLGDTCIALPAPKEWNETWEQLHDSIIKFTHANPKAAVIPGVKKQKPSLDDVMLNLESIDKIESIAKNLWLGDAIINNRLESHFQPIVDRNNQIFGYEAFARARTENGEFISGAKIIQAARELNIQHLMDKHLHILAIKTFAESQLSGNLFINFMTGFIQLPQKYLEGLAEAVKHYNIIPKRMVLDVSDSENVHDMNQVSAIIDFCSSKGYSVALDDINSLASLKNILSSTKPKPDFIKLDRHITKNWNKQEVIREIWAVAELAHQRGCMVLAEGIETEDSHNALINSSIDLFQGYHIGAPMAVGEIEALRKVI